jgi:hypothetical protein
MRARIMAAYGGILDAALGQLGLHYAARIAALAVCRRGDNAAALAALQAERDTAIERVREAVRQEREAALRAAEPGNFHRRFRFSGKFQPRLPRENPRRLIPRAVQDPH